MKKYLNGAKEVVYYCIDTLLWRDINNTLLEEGFEIPKTEYDFDKERVIEIQHHLGKIKIKFI